MERSKHTFAIFPKYKKDAAAGAPPLFTRFSRVTD